MMLSSLSTWSTFSVKSTKVSRVYAYWRYSMHAHVQVAGGKGRAAFCQAPPPVTREKKKDTDYSEYPLTSHGEMLYTLVQSGISAYPHKTVSMQFFETVARYGDFFKVRKECIMPTLQAMLDTRYVSTALWRVREGSTLWIQRATQYRYKYAVSGILPLLSVRPRGPQRDLTRTCGISS